jgi:sucrose-6-phosphate hydrolase SacC (GH32 family)
MKRILILPAVCLLLASAPLPPLNSFKDAVAAWNLADANDMTAENSQLNIHGDVKFIKLEGAEAEASKARGGDGIAAQFNGGWLDAGQGVNEELNLTGKNISVLVRLKPAEVRGLTPVLGKTGTDQTIAYSIYLDKIGEDTYVESKMGSDDIAGAHVLKYKIPKAEVSRWHDIVLRFNGQISQLFVDGSLRDDEVTVGEIRNWNHSPFLIGAQYSTHTTMSDEPEQNRFNGLIDHVVLWSRYITDIEVKAVSGVTELKDGKPVYYNEKYRPQFHFSAKKNWLNDPNGLVYYNGVYHLFFQYMPPNRPGAYKDWGHAISKDLVHWEQIPYHITPHKVWSGCWSGSAVVDVNNSAGFQSGKEKTIVAMLTNGGDPEAGLGPMCTQCIAYSNDGGTTFSYYDGNPVIHNIYKSNRDPKVVWDDVSKKWIMSLYMDKDYDFGIFSSSNLRDWKQLSTVSIEGVRECPGFEPLPVDGDPANKKWIFSGANGDYVIGSFDGTNFKPETKVLRGDYGMNYYAAQMWSDNTDGRSISIAWMPTQHYPGMPFEQQMTFPTTVSLHTTPDGIKAFRMPVDEISKLYTTAYTWRNLKPQKVNNLLNKLNGDLYDMNLDIDVKKASSFKIKLGNVSVSYNAATGILSCGGDAVKNGIVPDSRISSDKSKINIENNMGMTPLKPLNGMIRLRILLDRNTIEVFGNGGEVVLSSCFMPADDNKLYSFSANGEVTIAKAQIYALKSAWIN